MINEMISWFWREDGEFLLGLGFFWVVIPVTIYMIVSVVSWFTPSEGR
jgi:hypothetical protein